MNDGYRQLTDAEKAKLKVESTRVHAELRAHRIREGALKPANEVFSADFIQSFADTPYDDGDTTE